MTFEKTAAGCLVAAALKSTSFQQALQEFTTIAALVEPILILSLLVLMLAKYWRLYQAQARQVDSEEGLEQEVSPQKQIALLASQL